MAKTGIGFATFRPLSGPARAAAMGAVLCLTRFDCGCHLATFLAAEEDEREPDGIIEKGNESDVKIEPRAADMKKRPLVVAHRGASHAAVGNTLPAFQLAWEEDADAIELDVHLTRDDRIVVVHDDEVDIGGKAVSVKSLTLAELNAVVVKKSKGGRVVEGAIPGLEEVLAMVPKGKQVFVEIKSTDRKIVTVLEKVLAASGREASQIVLISFKIGILREAKERMPQYKALFLAGIKKDKKTGAWVPDVDELIRRAQEAELDGLDLNGPLTAEWVERIHRAGLEVHAWTINKGDSARRLMGMGVDGITTDCPASVGEALRTAEPDLP